MISKFSEKVSDEAAKSLFELAWSLASSFGKKTIDKIKVKKALNNYSENYFRRNGSIKVLGMHQPIPLNQIYTKVKLFQAHSGFIERDIEYLEHSFREKRGGYGDNRRGISAFVVANEKDKLNVLGAPGSGKSTLLKKIGLSILLIDDSPMADVYSHDCIPVFIELKRFRNGNIDIKQHIQEEFEIADFPESQEFVNNALKSGKLLLLLDGLDEIPGTNLESVIEHIKDFTDKYPLNRYITSCRTAFYKNYLKDYTDIEIASFEQDQITSFIDNWFSQEKDLQANTAERFKKMLFDNKNVATLELARTPLLLTFLCLTYDDGQYFPSNRSSLYKRAMHILLEKWSAEKRIHNEDVYIGLNSDIEIEMLAEIAAHFYQKDKIFFYSDELKQLITSFLKDTMDLLLPPVSKILEAIEVQQGLLVQRASDIYSFSHLTIQEYLTAYYFYSPKRTPLLIENYIFDAKWREVFLLQAGMSNSNDMISMMVDFLEKYVLANPILKEAIDWINRVIKTDNSEAQICKRVLLLEFLLHFKRDRGGEVALAYSNTKPYSTDIIDLLQPDFRNTYRLPDHIGRRSSLKIFDIFTDLTGGNRKYLVAKKQIQDLVPERPLNTMAPGSRYYFNKQVLLIIYKAFKVPETFNNLRISKYEPLNNYLEGFALIIECKRSSLRISPNIWSKVLGKIVR